MEQLLENIPTLLATYGLQVLGSIVILIVGRWLTGVLTNALKKRMRTSKIDQTLVNFASNILYYLLFAIVIVAALGNLGVPTTSMVAILGGLTLAVGLALQDSLGNFAAGIMIILLRPYHLGDMVEINGEYGAVTDVKIFHTKIKTPQNKVVYVPNSEVIGGNIINYNDEGIYRYDLVFGIGYGDDIRRAKQILLDILQSDDRIESDPAPEVWVGELGDSSVNLVARPWIKFQQHPAIRAHITEQVKLRFDEAGISIPFPQRDVHLFNAN